MLFISRSCITAIHLRFFFFFAVMLKYLPRENISEGEGEKVQMKMILNGVVKRIEYLYNLRSHLQEPKTVIVTVTDKKVTLTGYKRKFEIYELHDDVREKLLELVNYYINAYDITSLNCAAIEQIDRLYRFVEYLKNYMPRLLTMISRKVEPVKSAPEWGDYYFKEAKLYIVKTPYVLIEERTPYSLKLSKYLPPKTWYELYTQCYVDYESDKYFPEAEELKKLKSLHGCIVENISV